MKSAMLAMVLSAFTVAGCSRGITYEQAVALHNNELQLLDRLQARFDDTSRALEKKASMEADLAGEPFRQKIFDLSSKILTMRSEAIPLQLQVRELESLLPQLVRADEKKTRTNQLMKLKENVRDIETRIADASDEIDAATKAKADAKTKTIAECGKKADVILNVIAKEISEQKARVAAAKAQCDLLSAN